MTLKPSSNFHVLPGEATFAPPIEVEVVGGMHLAPEIITKSGSTFIMVHWPHGLPRHETTDVVRFPHGLMRFGETIDECATRLVNEQLGMEITRTQTINLDSYVDENGHWHLEPWILAEVTGEPKIPKQASRIVTFTLDRVPAKSLWTADELRSAVEKHLRS